MTKEEEDNRAEDSMTRKGEESFDLGPTHSGAMGGGASGPRDMSAAAGGQDNAAGDTEPGKAAGAGQTGGSGTGTQETGRATAPPDNGQEEIENYGSRREDTSDELLPLDRKAGAS